MVITAINTIYTISKLRIFVNYREKRFNIFLLFCGK